MEGAGAAIALINSGSTELCASHVATLTWSFAKLEVRWPQSCFTAADTLDAVLFVDTFCDLQRMKIKHLNAPIGCDN